jgi:hypothetical protein
VEEMTGGPGQSAAERGGGGAGQFPALGLGRPRKRMRGRKRRASTLGLGLSQLREEGEGGRRRVGRREELGQQAEKEGGRERIRFSFFSFSNIVFQIHFQKVFKTF